MTRKNLALSLVFCIGFGISSARAGTVNATSCSQSAVQSAVNSAGNGDTVTIPSCSNTTWTSHVSWSNKGILLQGAGVNVTNITDGTSDGVFTVSGASTSNFVEITGMTISSQTTKAGGMIQVGGTMFSQNSFRIHHMRLVIAAGTSRGIEVGEVYGLIDHVTF